MFLNYAKMFLNYAIFENPYGHNMIFSKNVQSIMLRVDFSENGLWIFFLQNRNWTFL